MNAKEGGRMKGRKTSKGERMGREEEGHMDFAKKGKGSSVGMTSGYNL